MLKFVKKWLKRLWDALAEMNWTVAGTILVLVTLSGPTQATGIQIFFISLIVNLIDIFIRQSKESGNE